MDRASFPVQILTLTISSQAVSVIAYYWTCLKSKTKNPESYASIGDQLPRITSLNTATLQY